MTPLWALLALGVGFLVGFVGAACFFLDRRPRAVREATRDLDRLIMLFQRERARAVELDAHTLTAHIDTVIGSLTRVRVAVAEGRSIDVDKELAAIVAADEQIVREM